MTGAEGPHEVNIGLGDDVSNMLYQAAKMSWENRPGAVVEMHPSFSGWRALHPELKPTDCYEGLGSDGIGTKVEVAERTQDFTTVAHDLFAMACDDAVVRGAEPIAIVTILDVNELRDEDILTDKAIRQIAEGYVAAASLAGVVILGGETAELGSRVGGYGPFNFNWCGTVLWYAQQDRVLTGHQIKPGDNLVGLVEPGFRANGITDVRNGMLETYGPEWQDVVVPALGELPLGKLVQKPSTIYSKLVTSLTGGYHRDPKVNVTGVAHITGGGQPSKLGRMLEPTGYGVNISNPITPPDEMLALQRMRGFSDQKAYGKWHMGPGMVIVVPPADVDTVIDEASAHGITAQNIGFVKEEPGIRIWNKGAVRDSKWLTF